MLLAIAALLASVSAQFCHPVPSPDSNGAQVPVSNGFLVTGDLVHKPHFGATHLRTLAAYDGQLVIDSRSPADISHHGSRFQILHCDASPSLYAGPSPFSHVQRAGLLATGDKCVTVKNGAVSLEQCASSPDSIAPQWFHFDGPFVVYAGDTNATAAAATLKDEKVVSLIEPKSDTYAVLALRDSPAGSSPHDMIDGPDMAIHGSTATALRPQLYVTSLVFLFCIV